MFFQPDEIQAIEEEQQFDLFEDIREMRDECLLNGLIGNTKLNKISIEMMAPKAEELQALKD